MDYKQLQKVADEMVNSTVNTQETGSVIDVSSLVDRSWMPESPILAGGAQRAETVFDAFVRSTHVCAHGHTDWVIIGTDDPMTNNAYQLIHGYQAVNWEKDVWKTVRTIQQRKIARGAEEPFIQTCDVVALAADNMLYISSTLIEHKTLARVYAPELNARIVSGRVLNDIVQRGTVAAVMQKMIE